MNRILAAFASAALALSAAAVARATPTPQQHAQNVSITIRAGDRITEPNVAVAPDVPIRITVTNLTHDFHTFTIPQMHLSELVKPAHGTTPGTTTFTITLQQWGAIAWHCVICPSGVHGRVHNMSGTLYAIIDPSALP